MSDVTDSSVSTADLHAQILALSTEYRQTEHKLAGLLARMAEGGRFAELGYATITAYGVQALDLSPRQARALVRLGRTLPRFPVLDQAFREGRLSWTKARELLRVVTKQNEAAWVERAESVTSRELERHIASTMDDKGPPDPSTVRGDSVVRLVFDVSAQEAQIVRTALETLRRQSQQGTEEIRDGDLLAQMAQRAVHDADPAAAPTGERYKIVLEHCPSCQQFVGRHDFVDATHVGHALCDAEIQEGRPGPKLGHLARTIPPAVRRAVVQRDRHRCSVPGCTSTLWIDLHHLTPRSQGGGHTISNLICLCGSHHRAIHDGVMGACAISGGARFFFQDGRVVDIAFRPLGGDPRGSSGGTTTQPHSNHAPAG